MVKILVLEDNVLSQDLLRSILIPQGYEVVCVADGCSGLAQIKEQQPDLVISDIDMPGLNGLEVLRQLRLDSATAALPVILCTSAEEDCYRRIAQKLNAVYITKPFYPTAMLEAIAQQLSHYSEA
ncbi:response regulator [Leptolyngbya sp. FACHB-17]|uniref:response regulator n=1 Tax=unclassified Leptolyngbya TaxID=2650499 RepID=UPI001680249A|nr:response regulator [Leptolyngbya sp. FACHB-17]MBD2080211.1 response regulator [Leptolyngbya sp. FACHB-17]